MSEALRAGAAQTDITPPLGAFLAGLFHRRPAEDVDDPLHAKAVVLESGGTRLALVVLDLIGLPRADVLRIRARVAERLGIPGEHVLIGCTHTHTGPSTRVSHSSPRDDTYVDWLVVRVADAVQLACNRLRPARLAWGRGHLEGVSFCRRFHMRDGTVCMNPGRGNPNVVRPTSPIDPEVGVVYVEGEDGAPLAVLARFSLHYVGTDNANHISADYYGHFAQAVRRLLGEGCLPLLFNGTSGQINAIDIHATEPERGHAYARRVARALAGEVVKVVSLLRPRGGPLALAGMVQEVSLPRKRITPQDVATARAILAGNDPSPGKGPFSYVVGMPIPERLRENYARGCLTLAEMPERFTSEVQALRIGELAWVGLPGEIFVETGFAIRESAPVPTFVTSLTNDAMGYIPPDHVFLNEGGYETWAQPGNPVGVGSEPALREAAAQLIARLFPESSQEGGAR